MREGCATFRKVAPGSSPAVSVVIPAYNASRFLPESLRSILDQSWQDLECIVVDDGSTDDTAEVVRAIDDVRLRYHRVERGGVAHARNTGMSIATGEWVAILDADDVWQPDKLHMQLAAASAVPGSGLVLCGYYVSSPVLSPQYRVIPADSHRTMERWLLLEGNGPAFGSTAMFRRALVEEVGGFDESLSTSADLEFAWRLAQSAAVVTVAEPLVFYRSHGGQMHRDMAVFERDMLRVFDIVLADEAVLRARGEANLYTRLALDHLRHGRMRSARMDATRVLAIRPGRLVALPATVLSRKLRQRSQAALRRRSGR